MAGCCDLPSAATRTQTPSSRPSGAGPRLRNSPWGPPQTQVLSPHPRGPPSQPLSQLLSVSLNTPAVPSLSESPLPLRPSVLAHFWVSSFESPFLSRSRGPPSDPLSQFLSGSSPPQIHRPNSSQGPPPQIPILAPQGSLLTPAVPAPLGHPLPSHPLSQALSRFPSQARGAGPSEGVSSPQSGLSKPLPELLSLESSPTPLRPGSRRLDSLCQLLPPRCSHLRPAVTTPGPASPPPLPLSHLLPSRSSAACSLVNTWVQSLNVRSSSAEPPPAVSASGPTLARRTPTPPSPPGASGTLPRQPLLLSEVRLLPGVANRTRLRRACSAPSSQSARPLHPATPLVRLR